MSRALTIRIPESVWDDFLSPDVSAMERELGLTERRADPFYRRAGKGGRRIYENVPPETAVELADYLWDRADTLLGQGVVDPYDPFEQASRAMLRRAMRLAEEIRP